MAGKTDIWMPLYIGDYLAATTHLSAMESGAYLHLLMHQWKNGRLPASEEALRRIARVDADAWSNAWEMLKTFFDVASGAPVQMRLETIREECDARKAKSSVKAQKAAEARWAKDAPSNAQAMPQPCPSSSSSSSSSQEKQKPTREKAASVDLPGWVDGEVWEGYLDVRRKKKAVMTERALKAVLKHLGEFRARGHDANAILETSMRSNWTDVYEPKGAGHGTNQGNQVRGQQRVDQAIDELRKAGVEVPDRPSEESAGEVRAAAWGGDGRDSPGVVLEAFGGGVQGRRGYAGGAGADGEDAPAGVRAEDSRDG